MRVGSPTASGHMPLLGTRWALHLWPNTPLKNAGRRIEPPMSLPRPTGAPPLPTTAPSPPELPPAVRPGS